MTTETLAATPIPSRPVAKVRRQIDALTGIRIVAAVWVVFFHIHGNIRSEFPDLYPFVGPVIEHGELGVDLFFALSGYVLALNYSNQMGRRFDRAAAATFWWARVARVWPVFAVTLVIAAVWHGALAAMRVGDPVPPNEFSVPLFFRQILLVALWTEGDHDRLMWNGPSWSVSAEAFAYALFPILALLFYRAGRALSRRTLMVLAFACVVPVSIFVGVNGGLYAPWMWMLRIVCGFLAGAFMFEALRDLTPSPRVRALASHGALAVILGVIAACYVAAATGFGHLLPMIAPVFVVLIGLMATGDRHVVRLLGTRAFVVGGAASYSVYMVHMLIIEPLWWTQGHVGFMAPGGLGSKLGFVVVPFVVLLAGYLMWRFVEEPARHALRRMSLKHLDEAPLTDSSRIGRS